MNNDFFYRIKTDTPIGKKLKKLMVEVSKVELAAHNLAESVGAVSWGPDVFNDYGGISVFEFKNNVCPDKRMYTLVKSENGIDWYAPRIEVNTEPKLTEVALGLKGHYGYIVSDVEKTFRQVSMKFSREEQVKLSGIELHGHPLEWFVREKLITKEEQIRLEMGESPESVIITEDQSLMEQLHTTLSETRMLVSALDQLRFRMVSHVKGNRKAVQLYKQMYSLPVIPCGTLNSIIGIVDKEYQAGIAFVDDFVYVRCHEKLINVFVQPVSGEEFSSVMNAIINTNVVAQA